MEQAVQVAYPELILISYDLRFYIKNAFVMFMIYVTGRVLPTWSSYCIKTHDPVFTCSFHGQEH